MDVEFFNGILFYVILFEGRNCNGWYTPNGSAARAQFAVQHWFLYLLHALNSERKVK